MVNYIPNSACWGKHPALKLVFVGAVKGTQMQHFGSVTTLLVHLKLVHPTMVHPTMVHLTMVHLTKVHLTLVHPSLLTSHHLGTLPHVSYMRNIHINLHEKSLHAR